MKKLLIIALAFVSTFSFAQDQRDAQIEAIKERMVRPNYTPTKRAEMQTKRMTLQLDLSQEQQAKVNEVLLAHFTENDKRFKTNKKSKKEMSMEEHHEMEMHMLDSQIELKGKMKAILDDQQYEKYSKSLDRFMRKRKGRKMKGRKQ